ncbi:hypothetical protein BKA56DRAFT_496098 [Ilyonectria sp. MPI-CAGE-AT-0026]|nr:hypothetical protein BKA56DRAFT_496098 [Ilyonectria sp. MPI-CAGE-AT-0026]
MDQQATGGTQRTRRCHTRSRNGCLTCRKRRVRCDGDQPCCARCISAGRLCEFSSLSLPLRDRRALALPCEQQPWVTQSAQLQVVWNGPLATKLADPFDSFAISMPFKSRELLHYCDQCSFSSLFFMIQHPDALRNTLLVAGLHYAWTVGGFRSYEPTFLFHKIETIRLLNEWVENSRSDDMTTFVRHIATLCFAECALGNVAAGETHLDGLVTVMDLHCPMSYDVDAQLGLNDELVNRYVILSWNSVHGLKSRIQGSRALVQMFGTSKSIQFSKMISLLHRWRSQEIGSFEMLLKSIQLVPYFGMLPSRTNFGATDGFPIIECLRILTKSAHSARLELFEGDPGWVWAEGSASRLTVALLRSHILSLSVDKVARTDCSTGQGFITSWCSMAITSGLYMHGVLGLWNGGEPIEPRLFKRLMLILMRDLHQTLNEVNDRRAADFWFWKAFVGAFSLWTHQLQAYDETMEAVEDAFNHFIRSWSEASNIHQWGGAQARLIGIAWSTNLPQGLADDVWRRAVEC